MTSMHEQYRSGSDDPPVRRPFPYRSVLGPEWWRLAGIAASATVGAGLMVLDPFVVRMVLSSFGSWSSLAGALAAFAGLRAVQEGVQFTFGVIARSAGERVRKRLVDDAQANVVGLQRDQISDDELVHAVGEQADKVQQGISSAGTVLFSALRMVGGIAGAIAMAGWTAALPFVLGGMGMTVVVGYAAKQRVRVEELLANVAVRVNTLVRDRIGGNGRSLRRQYGAIEQGLQEVTAVEDEQSRLSRRGHRDIDVAERGGNMAWHWLVMIPYFLLMNMNGGISPTMIALFDQGVNVIEGMKRIGPAFNAVPAGFQSARRLLGLRAMEPRVRSIKGGMGLDGLDLSRPVLELEGVCFERGSRRVLDGVRLAVDQGEIVLVKGESGVGKSTLLDLIARGEREPTAGKIFVHGVPLTSLDSAVLANLIGKVEQHSTFVGGTIRDNLLLAKRDADESRMQQVLRTVGLYESLDKTIESDGTGLSGGQRARLAIARCLLREAKILLWDEPTAALDKAGADEIGRLLCQIVIDSRRSGQPISALMVTHGDFKYPVDRTLVIEEGKIFPQAVSFSVPAGVPTAEATPLVASLTGVRLKAIGPVVLGVPTEPMVGAIVRGVLVPECSMEEARPLACQPGLDVNERMADAGGRLNGVVRCVHPLTPEELYRLMFSYQTTTTAADVERRLLERARESRQTTLTYNQIDTYMALVKARRHGDVDNVRRELEARGLVVVETDELRHALFRGDQSAGNVGASLTPRLLTNLGKAFAACEFLGAWSTSDVAALLPRTYALIKQRDSSTRPVLPVQQRPHQDVLGP